jgi:hypothetical protein
VIERRGVTRKISEMKKVRGGESEEIKGGRR